MRRIGCLVLAGLAGAAWVGASDRAGPSSVATSTAEVPAEAGVETRDLIAAPPVLAAPRCAPRCRATPPSFPTLSQREVGGCVVDAEGRAVAGADVRMADALSEPDPREAAGDVTTRTDDTGRFRMAAPEASSVVRLVAHAAGRGTGAVPEAIAGVPVLVRLDPDGTVGGTVRDLGGRPVAGACVAIVSRTSGGYAVRTAVTGPDGRFESTEVPVDAAACDGRRAGPRAFVEAAAEGFAPARRKAVDPLPGARRAVADVVLGHGFTLRGRVVAGEDQVPVQGAEVEATAGLEFLTDVRRARTDSSGRFTLPGLPAKDHGVRWVRVTAYPLAPGIEPQFDDVSGEEGAWVRGNDVHLSPALVRGTKTPRPRARGTVLLPDGGPARGARLVWWFGGPWDVPLPPGSWDSSTTTDAAGRFSLERGGSEGGPLGQGLPDLRVFLPGFAAPNVPAWSLPTDGDVVVRLVPEAPIRGRVVDLDGSPVASVRVRLCDVATRDAREEAQERADPANGDPPAPSLRPFQADARTAADGGFEIRAVPDGRYDLQIVRVSSRHGGRQRWLATVRDVAAPAFVEARLCGRVSVRSEDPPPRRDVEVTVLDPVTGGPLVSPLRATAWLDPERALTTREIDVLPAGRLRLAGALVGCNSLVLESPAFPSQAIALAVPPGEGPLAVRVRPVAGPVVRLHVRAPEDVPPEDVWVRLRTVRGGDARSVEPAARDAGGMTYLAADAGSWEAVASVLGRDDVVPEVPLRLDLPASGLVDATIVLVRAGTLRVRWRVLDRETDEDAQGDARLRLVDSEGRLHHEEEWSSDRLEGDGERSIRLPAGEYRVALDVAGVSRESRARVAGGGTTEVVLEPIPPLPRRDAP